MTPPQIAVLFFAQGFVSNNPAARLTVCPQPAWNYDFSSDPSVPELAQLGEAIKYFKPISIQIVDKIYRRHIGHYRPEAALEAMEGVKGFETALQRYVHARLDSIAVSLFTNSGTAMPSMVCQSQITTSLNNNWE